MTKDQCSSREEEIDKKKRYEIRIESNKTLKLKQIINLE